MRLYMCVNSSMPYLFMNDGCVSVCLCARVLCGSHFGISTGRFTLTTTLTRFT